MTDTPTRPTPNLGDIVAQRLGTKMAQLEIELANAQILADQFARQVQEQIKAIEAKDAEIAELEAAVANVKPDKKQAKAAA